MPRINREAIVRTIEESNQTLGHFGFPGQGQDRYLACRASGLSRTEALKQATNEKNPSSQDCDLLNEYCDYIEEPLD